MLKDISILIPAYRPDFRLNKLIDELTRRGFTRIIVVDDGSGPRYAKVFNEAWLQGARVLVHEENKGKGAALKTGLKWMTYMRYGGVVACDADGQHSVEDVVAVAQALRDAPDALILGVRDLKKMPLKSRVGNRMTRTVLGLKSGLWLTDTQTGLRGLPERALPLFAGLPGDRFEYETTMLLEAQQRNLPILEVPIETRYFNHNARTHFKPWRDGARIYAQLLHPAKRRRSLE